MKKFLLFVFLFFVSNSSFAKDDSVFVKIESDTVQIWNTDVSANCASRFSLKTEIAGNAIVVTECDTLGPLADCFCIYDLHSSLTGLTAGHYSVAVYRQELKKYFYDFDTTIFIDSLEFTLGNSSSLPKNIMSNQSACHTATSIDKEEANPESFLLLSNYPNPFNPSTVISWQLAVGSHVTLKIYDVLGNEVGTLVNEEQQAGNHSVNFYSTNNNLLTTNKLSGGVYYYTLKAGNFVQTRGMIYLK
ncbi:MAG: T9SS type A sorting domain-containing protein [Ignavibacteriaceae bacterium]